MNATKELPIGEIVVRFVANFNANGIFSAYPFAAINRLATDSGAVHQFERIADLYSQSEHPHFESRQDFLCWVLVDLIVALGNGGYPKGEQRTNRAKLGKRAPRAGALASELARLLREQPELIENLRWWELVPELAVIRPLLMPLPIHPEEMLPDELDDGWPESVPLGDLAAERGQRDEFVYNNDDFGGPGPFLDYPNISGVHMLSMQLDLLSDICDPLRSPTAMPRPQRHAHARKTGSTPTWLSIR